jgi:hypothetical protein
VEDLLASDPIVKAASWPAGAYVDRDDPSIVFVFACADADAPGGKFSATGSVASGNPFH